MRMKVTTAMLCLLLAPERRRLQVAADARQKRGEKQSHRLSGQRQTAWRCWFRGVFPNAKETVEESALSQRQCKAMHWNLH